MGVPMETEEVQPSETPFESDLPLLPPKKATRQWAAWTRQEEENFFNALRQVGKNFEKITCRVQSKNKDQVRHYYYRLARRMNKLLGPGFSLDARNSKDTIAAMLRWWSLLEKYSCTASKLHLKPRRFKTFIEALAHQLLKDRNKTNRRKRPSHEESYSFVPATSASVVTKGSSGNDVRPVKLIFLDNQKLQKLGYAKANSSKGNVDTSSKAGFVISKPMKQSKRTGLLASAAYKRWEKAAVAGVSLVADAAEQLERTNSDGISPNKRGTVDTLHGRDPVREDMSFAEATVHPLSSRKSDSTDSHNNREMFLQPFAKLKLQLFPVDEITRKALEKDNHNPFLELTLSARKRVPSILEHLNRKWGHSEIASRELLLLPYGIQVDDLASCQKWTTRDGALSAADVYIALGRPNMFRLRYVWLPNSDIGSEVAMRSETTFGSSNGLQPSIGSDEQAKNIIRSRKDEPPEEEIPLENSNVAVESQVASTYMNSNDVHLATMKPMSSSSLAQGELPHGPKSKVEEERQRPKSVSILSPGDWADSLTNISIGDLLAEASRSQDSIHIQPGDGVNTGVPFSCDSFDAAIAAHLSGYNDLWNASKQPSPGSMWDAEETCDGFLFKNNSSQYLKDQRGSLVSSNGPFKEITQTNRSGFHDLLDNVAKIEPSDAPCEREVKVGHEAIKEDVCPSHDKHDTGNNIGLMDIYWPDSLGTLDLEIPSSRCLGQDMILGDSISLNGLSRLIANSLDAFQNRSFIGSDKRPPAANEALEKNSPLGEVDNK